MDIADMHALIQKRISMLDFTSILPDFHAYPFALYNQEHICLDGQIISPNETFRGNTAIEYDGRHVAIWNFGDDPIADPDLLTSQLVHEMFHCHQHALGETRYPDDLAMLNNHDDLSYYQMKHHEHILLADACEHLNASAFLAFAAQREARRSAFPAATEEDFKAETIEGTAEFVGLMALRQLDVEKFAIQLDELLSQLRQESLLIFDARRMCYFSGAVLALTMVRLGYPLRNNLRSPLTLWEQNLPTALPEPGPVPKYDFIPSTFAAHRAELRLVLDDFLRHAAYHPCEAAITGYDPMNMFRLDTMLYCSHFVKLSTGECFVQPIALTLASGTYNRITGYYKEE